jgi:lipooligosaccharide transport system permease protein
LIAGVALRPALARTGAVTAWHARSYRRVWRATVTTAFLNPVFFLLSMGVLLGGLVDDANADLGGLSYLEFVAPGLLAAMAMQVGTNEATFPVMAGVKWLRTYHAVVATPVRVGELVAGMLTWAAVRIGIAVVVFSGVAAVAGAFPSTWAVLAPAAALLCGLAFAAPIAAFSASLEDDSALPALTRFVIIPMFLFSGTFFPVEQLPRWLEPVAWATPLWHGVTMCRDLASGGAEAWVSAGHAAYLLAFLVVGAWAAVRVHERRLLK